MKNEADIVPCQVCSIPIVIKCYNIHLRACQNKNQTKTPTKETNYDDLIPCQQCGDKIDFSVFAVHMEECVGRQLMKCEKCKLLYPSFLFEEHASVCNNFREEEQSIKYPFQQEQEYLEQEQDHQLVAMIMELAQSALKNQQPLSLQIIQKIKNIVLNTTQECSICYCAIPKNSSIIRLKNCTHNYHIRCLTAWLQKNPNCPMCRRHALL